MFHHVLTDTPGRTLLEHDIALYGWTVVWEFACYVTDQMIEEDFGPGERLLSPLPNSLPPSLARV